MTRLVGWAGVPASASLRSGAGGPVQADCTTLFLGVKLMYVVVVILGHVQLLRFIVLKHFWSCFNPNFGHLDLVM